MGRDHLPRKAKTQRNYTEMEEETTSKRTNTAAELEQLEAEQEWEQLETLREKDANTKRKPEFQETNESIRKADFLSHLQLRDSPCGHALEPNLVCASCCL